MLLEIITPAMLTALVVGLGIGLLQALTQIQEHDPGLRAQDRRDFRRAAARPAFRRRRHERTDDRHRRSASRRISADDTSIFPNCPGIVLTYLLVFARVGAMVMLLPAIGEDGRAAAVRLVLALAISFALAPRCRAPIRDAPQRTHRAWPPDRAGSHRRRAGRRHGAHHHERACRWRAI